MPHSLAEPDYYATTCFYSRIACTTLLGRLVWCGGVVFIGAASLPNSILFAAFIGSLSQTQ